ncbi:MAG: hypothetical protein E5X48_14080 [Mesorhizobium sp.]|uniref:hypothetical protein n=1 Tax=Mesorhizobium sp. TaxID=1871066 RepID=UPI00121A27DF|nr:hypothetical protein [Mesorhizobium sp.]TIQ35491.1 MAG: hypothetical protein E5X48_14080 [Mesorhizobium sp.]
MTAPIESSPMESNAEEDYAEDREYVVVPEEAIQFLPPEWRDAFQSKVEDSRAILEAVDSDIKNLIRLVGAFQGMASLSYIHHRLSKADFNSTTEAILEHDMLTSAFVIAYVRLIDGGIGSGVSRKTLPPHLRKAHDEIIELRNKRFAHNAGHRSVDGKLDILFGDGRFDVSVTMQVGYYVRGANEWGELVTFLNGLMFDRLTKLLERLKDKTGCEWTFPSGPPPAWSDSR